MQLGFFTESEKHAKAALLIYAMYRSRDKASPLTGMETWNRAVSFIRGATLKSTTTAEFCNNFCHMAKIGSIKPKYLSTDGGMVVMADGSIIQSDNVRDYKLDLMQDDRLLPILENEGQFIVMLVRERLQREKMEETEDEAED